MSSSAPQGLVSGATITLNGGYFQKRNWQDWAFALVVNWPAVAARYDAAVK